MILFCVPLLPENIEQRKPDPQCAVCRDFWQREVNAEVDHSRVQGGKKKVAAEAQPGLNVCLDCALSERWMNGKTSGGQVSAFKLLRECALPGCGGNQSGPMWFCFACFKYICNGCKHSAVHFCEGNQVGFNKIKSSFIHVQI